MTTGAEFFEVLFENNPHPTWVYDTETLRFLEVNRAAIQKYGYSRTEFLAMRITDIRPNEDVNALLEEMRNGRPVFQSKERRYQTKDGHTISVEVTSNLAKLNGRIVAVVVAEDLTERKHAQKILVRAREAAEQATRFKDQFLSTMSHELRTPLNSVLGFSELLLDDREATLTARQRRYAERIRRGGQHLLKLINDTLDLSRIQAGRFELVMVNLPLADAFEEVLSTLKPLADRRSQVLDQSVKPDVWVRADATRLKQVLFNLAGNAIKFSPQGGVIRLAAHPDGEMVRIEVSDNGPGIHPEEQNKIFEPFYLGLRSDSTTEGTGLGLAISQRLIELHGSKLALDTGPGKGSRFHFTLPMIKEFEETDEGRRTDGPQRGPSRRILVIEDDPATAELICSQLSGSGYEVFSCLEPRKAHDMAAKLQPDAITLDLLMKPMNGWEVLVELKGDHRTEKIPVIMLSVLNQAGMGATLGADEYLVKPVDQAVFLSALKRCIRPKGAASTQETVLVVEDDATTREILTTVLQNCGYEVQTASDGEEARVLVTHYLPQLIVLDLLLPRVSGFDLIQEWRANPRTADLPIFVLTGKDLSHEETKYLQAKAELLVRKELDWQATLARQLDRAVPQQQAEAL